MSTAVVIPAVPEQLSLEQKFAKIEGAAASAAVEEVKPAATPAVTPEETPAAVPPAEVTPPEEPTEGETPEAEVDLEAVPETSGDFGKYKGLFRENPELRQILGREKAFSEMQGEQPFSEFRRIHELIPTVMDAEKLVEEAENTREFGRIYRESPKDFISNLRESDALAFQKLASELPDILAKTDLNLWREQATSYLEPVLQNLFGIATQGKDEELIKAVQLVAQNLGITGGRRSSPIANPEVEELKRKLAEKEKSETSQAFESFWKQTDDKVIDRTLVDIEGALKKALPDATESQMKRMVNEAYSQTLESLGAQPQFVAQMDTYRQSAMKGRQGISEHNAIVDFATKRAKLVIPRVAAKVASEWSDSILQKSKATTEKKQAIAAKTKDVGSGPQATTSAAAATPKTGKRTAEDVFKALESGTYVRR